MKFGVPRSWKLTLSSVKFYLFFMRIMSFSLSLTALNQTCNHSKSMSRIRNNL
uniref:Uncharacterized protein n=1 Tax=Arundo donax TaxID=35708 RepID=A0A0A9CY46_ARUDO